ncbi:MAG: hypothetical protein ACJA01_003990 [Saprospiraceae bacterium]|jgi:hypothetical protein
METTDHTPLTKKNKKENFFSEWLEQLQQESWQLELLISGLALFGIWESRGSLQKLEYYFDVNVISEYSAYVGILMLVLWSGWAIFLINLLIHIIVRGLWIGAIGLRYVSGDIDFDTFNYSDIFIKYLDSTNKCNVHLIVQYFRKNFIGCFVPKPLSWSVI